MALWDKWIDRQMTRLGFTKAAAPPLIVGGGGSSLTTAYDTMDAGQRERLALACAWISSDMQYIINVASESEFYVEAAGETVPDHPYAALRKRPNPDLDAVYLWTFALGWILLRGRAYEWLMRDRTGEIVEIWPVPAPSMQPVPDPERRSGRYISHFQYTPPQTGIPIPIPATDVTYYRRPNLFDLYDGMGFLGPLELAVQTDRSAALWNRDAFQSEMTLRTSIGLPVEMPDTQYRATKEEIRAALVDEHARYIIARTGQVKVEQFGISPKDAEYLASRTFNREEIDRVLGFPAGFWAKEATRANSDAARAVVVGGMVWPLLNLLAAAITSQVLAYNYSPAHEGKFTDIRGEDRDMVLRERQQYWPALTVDECRAEIGYKPIGDGRGKALYGQAGASLEAAPATGPAAMAVDPDAIKAELGRWESVSRRRARAGEKAAYDFQTGVLTEAARRMLYAELEGVVDEAGVRALFAGLKAKEPDRAAEEAIRKRVVAVLREYLGPVAQAPAAWAQTLAQLPDDLRAALTAELAQIVRRHVLAESTTTGVDFDEVAVNRAALEWAREYSFELVKGLTETTRAMVEQAVTTWTQTPGMTQADITALLEPAFGPARAENIGTTEVTRALSQATTIHKDLLAETGIQMEEVWNTSRDAIVCPICGPANGKSETDIISVAPYDGKTWKETFPGGPPAHPRCRCWKTLRVTRR